MNFNVETFLFDTPLYTKIILAESDEAELDRIMYLDKNNNIDGYNPFRKTQTTFEIVKVLTVSSNHFPRFGGVRRVTNTL